MASGFPWPAEMTERLRALVLAGTTASEAASVLGTTRNAVMGKFNRIRAKMVGEERNAFRLTGNRSGLHLDQTPEQREHRREQKRLAEQRRRDRMKLAASLRLPNQPVVSEELPGTPSIGIMELTIFTCRWPVGHNHPQMYCGAPKEFSAAYCPTHSRASGRPRREPEAAHV